MSEVRRSRSETASKSAFSTIVIVSLIAAALSGYMWVESARLHAQGLVGPLPGCPDTDLISCSEVLASRYSQCLGIPLAAAGTINYLLLLTVGAALVRASAPTALRWLWTAGLALAATGTFAGIWLLIVQAFFLHRFCVFCDITHACGLVSLLALLAYRPPIVPGTWRAGAGILALAGTFALVLGQTVFKPQAVATTIVFTPPTTQPVTGQATQPSVGSQPSLATRPAGSQPAGAGLIPAIRPANAFDITDAAGTVVATLDLDNEILLGDPTADRTLVEFMDFGCPECKQEFGFLQQIMKKNPKWFRVVILLFPGNKDCNSRTNRERPHVCEIAQAAVAIRKHSPEHYQDAHAMFFKLQTLPLTGGMAWNLAKEMCRIDDQALQAWQNDPTLLEKIKQDVEVVHLIISGQNIKKTVQLPGLFASGKLIAGAAESVSDLEKHLVQLIGPPPVAAAGSQATSTQH